MFTNVNKSTKYGTQGLNMSRDSSVRIAPGYGLDGVLGFDSRRGLGVFLFTTVSRTALEQTTHLHLVPRSKNVWSYTSTTQYAFMAWCLVKHRDNLTFTFNPGIETRVSDGHTASIFRVNMDNPEDHDLNLHGRKNFSFNSESSQTSSHLLNSIPSRHKITTNKHVSDMGHRRQVSKCLKYMDALTESR
jgi:hypothetical protein